MIAVWAWLCDAVRVAALPSQADRLLRNDASRALHAVINAATDPDDAVATDALFDLTVFPLRSDATAETIWILLQGRLSEITKRFGPMLRAERSRHRRKGVIAVSRLAAPSLATVLPGHTPTDSSDAAVNWAAKCVSDTLEPLCVASDTRVAIATCDALLHVCASATDSLSAERVAKWGAHGVSRIVNILRDLEEDLAPLLVASLVQDATRALAALSKNDFVNSAFVISSGDGLPAHASTCRRAALRVEVMSVIAATVVEFDLAGRDNAAGACLLAVTRSATWKRVLADNEAEDGADRRAETVCCFSMALLDASRKTSELNAPMLREDLTDIWAHMLANLLRAVPFLALRFQINAQT